MYQSQIEFGFVLCGPWPVMFRAKCWTDM